MKQETYIKITNKIRDTKHGEKILLFLNKFLTDMVYIAFFYLLLQLIIVHRYEELIRILLVTGISFFIVSVIRHLLDVERPYVKYNFTPLVQKEKTGDSMPSRHVFSAFVIGMALWYINAFLGGIIFIIGMTMAVIRVLVGVHFPKDVIVGAAIGIISGIIGFYVI